MFQVLSSRIRGRALPWAVLALVVAVGLVGCNGGSESPATGTTTVESFPLPGDPIDIGPGVPGQPLAWKENNSPLATNTDGEFGIGQMRDDFFWVVKDIQVVTTGGVTLKPEHDIRKIEIPLNYDVGGTTVAWTATIWFGKDHLSWAALNSSGGGPAPRLFDRCDARETACQQSGVPALLGLGKLSSPMKAWVKSPPAGVSSPVEIATIHFEPELCDWDACP